MDLQKQNENEDIRRSQFQNFLKQNMQAFWNERMAEIQNASDLRTCHPFPLARIKRIIKSNEKIERFGVDIPVLLGKACEFFVMELALQASFYQQETKLRTLQHSDIGKAINSNNRVNFLSHIIRARSQKEAMKNLKETLFRPSSLVQSENVNPPEELELLNKIDAAVENPTDSLNMNPVFSLGSEEIPNLFAPSTSEEILNSRNVYIF